MSTSTPSSTSSSSSSFPPVVPQHCSTVPVLFELLKGEEEQCREWLRAEMNKIPDSLIDSLFAGLIMSSSSSSAVPQHRSTVSELGQQLEGEKVQVRMVLRDEMDRVTDSLFEILNNKLRTNSHLGRSENGDYRAQVGNLLGQFELHQPASPIPIQPSFSPNSQQEHSNGNELNTEEIFEIKEEVVDGEETRVIDIAALIEDYQVKREIKEENEMELKYVMDKATQTNEQDWVKREIKEEEEDGEVEEEIEDNLVGDGESRNGENERIETAQQMDEQEIMGEFDYGQMVEMKQKEEEGGVDETWVNDIDEVAEDNQGGGDVSRSVEFAPMDTTRTHPTGQFQANFRQPARIEKRKKTDHEPQFQMRNEVNSQEDTEEGEEEDEHELAQPTKRPRMDSTQPNNAQPEVVGVSQQKPTEDTQPTEFNNQDRQIITVHLRCPESDCPETFAENELTKHMKERHSLGPNRCSVKDCKQSFHNRRILSDHVKLVHQHTSQWHCGKCASYFTTYRQLSSHIVDNHQLGHFQCSFAACTFTGANRMKVYNHYKREHKPELMCEQCDYRTKLPNRLKEHKRTHLGIKPYRCKWPNCVYSNASQNTIMSHIKKSHFNPKTSSSDVPLTGKPADYIEVIHSLL